MGFSDNVWWTRKARIQAEKRLLSNALQSQLLLLWYSFIGVVASVYYLKFEDKNTDLAGITWVIYSILILCISGFISALSLKERASHIKECYERLSSIYHKSKIKKHEEEKLVAEYESILGVCENHTDADYYKALCIEYWTNADITKLDRKPRVFHWCMLTKSMIIRFAMFTALYSLPFILNFILRATQ
jgi:hypothetical protein